ncbi:MAG: hypothetical protein KDD28_10510, partial [Phaeodactylibacter sp.]|nr:hypothetical protein [Phaeodactylibacter sp.]
MKFIILADEGLNGNIVRTLRETGFEVKGHTIIFLRYGKERYSQAGFRPYHRVTPLGQDWPPVFHLTRALRPWQLAFIPKGYGLHIS